MDGRTNSNPSQLVAILKMIANPGDVVKSQMLKVPWPYTILISGLAFTLFFLQTGLDLFRAGSIGMDRVILITLIGLFFGTAGVVFLAMMSYLLAQAGKRNLTVGWVISSFALGYSVTLIYSLCGLLFSLAFHWNTAVAFGITGVLWSLRPTLFTIKAMSGDATAFSVVLTTLCGALMLFSWGLLGLLGF
jgi:hypothetical protein